MSRFGSIGTQYFDNSGDPLSRGFLYFFNSGTNVAKDTFADINLSIKNPHPVPLTAAGRQPNIFFDGTARAVLTDENGLPPSGVQIEERDPVGGEADIGVFSPWNSLTLYGFNDIVEALNNKFYVSIQNNNQGNDPLTNPAFWTEFLLVKKWNANENYNAQDLVQGSNGLVYQSRNDGNSGNNPVTDLSGVFWSGAAAVDLPAVIRSASKTFAYRNF